MVPVSRSNRGFKLPLRVCCRVHPTAPEHLTGASRILHRYNMWTRACTHSGSFQALFWNAHMLEILLEYSVPPNIHDIRQEAWTMEISALRFTLVCIFAMIFKIFVSYLQISQFSVKYGKICIIKQFAKMNLQSCRGFSVWTTVDLNLNCSMAGSCVCEYHNLRHNWLFCLSTCLFSLPFLVTLMYILRNALTINEVGVECLNFMEKGISIFK